MPKTNKQNKSMTINQAIAKLTRLRNDSRLGGDTVLTVCLDMSGYEYMGVSDLTLDQGPQEADGCLCLVRVSQDNHGL